VDCYRCIKIAMMNKSDVRGAGRNEDMSWRKEAIGQVTRYMRPTAVTKRLAHLMIEGGREGQFIGRREKAKRASMGAGRFGPHEVADFRWGGFEHPTQTARGSKREVVRPGMKPALEGPYTGYKIANPATRGVGGMRALRGGNAVRMFEVGGARPFAVEFKGNVFSFRTKKKAEEIAQTFAIAALSGPTMIRAAMSAASAHQFKNNPYAGLYEAPHSKPIVLRNPSRRRKAGGRVMFTTKDGRTVTFFAKKK